MTGKIIGYASDICWWQGHLGQEVPILDVYKPTGYIKIRVLHTEQGFEDGWIPPEYLEVSYQNE